jgi:hypothetical protein
LDYLLRPHPIPEHFDFLSIDIDGNDYHAWEAIEAYRPRLVLIEYNQTIANAVDFVQSRDPATNQGASAAALVNLAKRKGYELIAVTQINLLFTTHELFGLFDITDNSLAAMREDSDVPHIFVGQDGHVFLRDSGLRDSGLRDLGDAGLYLRSHALVLPESAVQLVPKRLQKYPGHYTDFEFSLYRYWSFFKRPKPLRRAVMHCWNFVKRAIGNVVRR